ncbi:MAG: hypothetical protein MUO91_08530 [candidate division Zixibacteria bacterium]|nr:hypothetical protein [candidate division Zixibacteria bacterium]
MIYTINGYSLNSNVNDYPEGALLPFSEDSYASYETFGIKRLFKNEKFYWIENKVFLNKECSEAVLATVNDRIYKIMFRIHDTTFENCSNTRNQIVDYVFQYFNFQAEVIELDESKKLLCWDSAHGNVILEVERWDTAIILTSNIVKDAIKCG